MNNKERRLISQMPSGLDEAVNKKFPNAKCISVFSIVEMRYLTKWNTRLPINTKRQIIAFIEGYMAGHESLGNALHSLKQ